MNKNLYFDKLIFKKIKNRQIFCNCFNEFKENNKIIFSKKGIAIIYGPNGSGKTSLSEVLKEPDDQQNNNDISINYIYKGIEKNVSSDFHVIDDQNNRNIIKGKGQEFILGDDITKKYELKEKLEGKTVKLFNKAISFLKNNKITSKKSKIIDLFSNNPSIKELLKNMDYKSIDKSCSKLNFYMNAFQENQFIDSKKIEYDRGKLEYFKNEYYSDNSAIYKIDKLFEGELSKCLNIEEVRENEEAIKILEDFIEKTQCIVCDTKEINSPLLLERKKQNKENILKQLNDKTKDIIENMFKNINESNDLFNLKVNFLAGVKEGNWEKIFYLKEDINHYKNIFANEIINGLKSIFKESKILDDYNQYEKIKNDKINLINEDIEYIQKITENYMSKKLDFKIDSETNEIKIFLNENELLGSERRYLPLSAGEQNFLSLTFEFLKAKKLNKEIIVLDDPISSFDSIYKYKICYAILKILENKKIIILTHNIDLIRLFDLQFKNSFTLFLFNNIETEENGFIQLKEIEIPLLISMTELFKMLREIKDEYIKNKKLFLISLIPLMRKYSEIIGDKEKEDDLSQLMHPYYDKQINMSEIYKVFFQKEIDTSFALNVQDILNININNGINEIVDNNVFPLLNRALVHTLTYLYLRLIVENKLITKYSIHINKIKQNKLTLGGLISECFPKNNINREFEKIRNFLVTKKTLLNEFNHFQGTISIFQPAIDINNVILRKEKESILNFVNNDQIV